MGVIDKDLIDWSALTDLLLIDYVNKYEFNDTTKKFNKDVIVGRDLRCVRRSKRAFENIIHIVLKRDFTPEEKEMLMSGSLQRIKLKNDKVTSFEMNKKTKETLLNANNEQFVRFVTDSYIFCEDIEMSVLGK